MTTLTEKYVNLFTDFGFKKIFGEEVNKDILIDFLNELLYNEQGRIINLTYLKSDQLGTTDIERKAIFDLYCENEKGEKFIIELQKSKQAFFKDRALYYATFPIRSQAQRTDWKFELKAIFTIGILDFVFDEDKHNLEKYRYDVKLSDIETNKIFYDKLTFIYLEIPKFTKQLSELTTRFEKWLYAFKNLHKLDKLPDELHEKIFERLFELAELAKFTPEQVDEYEGSLKVYRDLQNSLETAKDEGIVIGKKIGEENKAKEIAINLIQNGIALELISKSTGLSVIEIEKLKIID
jgi:predicted transposase/invertase (TIGR01784 family)